MTDTAAFKAAIDEFRASTYWSSAGKLARGYSKAYTSEAAVLSAFMDALAAGQSPAPPNLGSAPTKFGHGLATMLAAMDTGAAGDLDSRVAALEQKVTALQSAVAALQAGGGASGPANRLPGEFYGFRRYDDGFQTCDGALAAMNADLGSTQPHTVHVDMPPGIHRVTKPVLNMASAMFEGPGMLPVQWAQGVWTAQAPWQGPDKYRYASWLWDGPSGTPMLGQSGGSTGVLKPGWYMRLMMFYNNRRDYLNDACYLYDVNDGIFEYCGFHNWRRNIEFDYATSAQDNAHWGVKSCPSYGTDVHLQMTRCFGVVVEGAAEVIGEGNRLQVAVNIAEGGSEVSVHDLKAVGCRGGMLITRGGAGHFEGLRSEGCGDASHPWADVQSSGVGESGCYNSFVGCKVAGRTYDELPLIFRRHATGNSWTNGNHAVMGSWGTQNGVAYVGNQVRDECREYTADVSPYGNEIRDQYTQQAGFPPAGGWPGTAWGVNGQKYKRVPVGTNLE